MIRAGLVGLGKTGKEIAKVLLDQKGIKLVTVICSPGSDKKGKDIGEIIGYPETGIIVDTADNLEEVIFRTNPDVVVDFSSTEATMKNSKIFSKMKVNMVICTTGFSKFSLKRLVALTRKYHNGICCAPNITLGVNVLMLISNLAANILNNYDFQITEIHHKRKKDAPSGTALKIAKEVEKGLISSGAKGNEQDVPITAIRAGGVVGMHEVMIIGEQDKIEIKHESFSRKAFAEGAMRAVRYMYKKTGYYEMNDVLKLGDILGDYLKRENRKLNKRYKYFKENKEQTNKSFA
jgi:4-hydroxy-tetrahydrodipicolinate reductase